MLSLDFGYNSKDTFVMVCILKHVCNAAEYNSIIKVPNNQYLES